MATEETSIPKWSLADRLRKSLEHAGVEVDNMAQYLEVHPNTIRNWIAGRTRPRPSDLKLWAMRTGVPHRWLLSGDDANGSRGEHVDSHHEHRPNGRLKVDDWSKKIPPDWNSQLHQAIPTDPRPRSLEAA